MMSGLPKAPDGPSLDHWTTSWTGPLDWFNDFAGRSWTSPACWTNGLDYQS